MASKLAIKRFIDRSIRRAIRDESAWDNYRKAVEDIKTNAEKACYLINSTNGARNNVVGDTIVNKIKAGVNAASMSATAGGTSNLGKAQSLFVALRDLFQSLKEKFFYDNPALDANGVAKEAKTALNKASKSASLAEQLAQGIQANTRNNSGPSTGISRR